MMKARVVELMQVYFAPDERQVAHALQVTAFGSLWCVSRMVRWWVKPGCSLLPIGSIMVPWQLVAKLFNLFPGLLLQALDFCHHAISFFDSWRYR
jgi:hypothetical protein